MSVATISGQNSGRASKLKESKISANSASTMANESGIHSRAQSSLQTNKCAPISSGKKSKREDEEEEYLIVQQPSQHLIETPENEEEDEEEDEKEDNSFRNTCFNPHPEDR